MYVYIDICMYVYIDLSHSFAVILTGGVFMHHV